MKQLHEHVGGLEFDRTLTKTITDALIEQIILYNGYRIEINWKFTNPLDNAESRECFQNFNNSC